MKAARSNSQLFADGQQFEKAGKWEDAATAYQRVVNNDPGNQHAVARLMVVYRKLKDHSRELAVIDAAINAAAKRDKTAQQEWISAHPEAARLGKAVLKQLGGESVTAYGTDPFVEKLMKRRTLVERKTGGGRKKAKRLEQKRKGTAAPVRKEASTKEKRAATRKAEIERKKKEVEARRAAAEKKKREAEARKAEAERKKKEVEAQKAAKKAEAEKRRAEKEAKAHPSLFIVSLRYLVPLERIDAAMKDHVAFLDKHFAKKEFLVAGRLVPRTGGIILVKAKSREVVEKIMRQDPFIKRKLASVDIVEFVASKMDKRLHLTTG